MYFVKTYKAGGADYDPRQKIWALYRCSLCKKESLIEVTRTIDTFDFSVERRCEKCGMINSDDRVINMKAQIDKLTMEKSRIQVQIEKLETELNEVTETKGCNNEKH
ncbi:MAG: hypothetical protein PHF86_15175 [Candidatus Nanoarchaeia archaeon]|nr:hypothetical protein [Candidatus Nanoarchaeia archaeon]